MKRFPVILAGLIGLPVIVVVVVIVGGVVLWRGWASGVHPTVGLGAGSVVQTAPAIDRAQRALDVIADVRNERGPFLENHAALKGDLEELETAAHAALHDDGTTIADTREKFSFALDTAIEQADVIAKRAKESAANKGKAREIREKFKSIKGE